MEKAKTILPKNYGILLFDGKIKRTYQKAGISKQLNAASQLQQLTKKEIQQFFRCSNAPEVLVNYKKSAINTAFKEILKKRYSKRWNFIVQNSKSILPIDIQYFFNANIPPQIIYK